MALNHKAFDDFVQLTLDNFKKKNWVDLSADLQRFIIASKFFKKNKQRERGGTYIHFKFQDKRTGNARFSGLFDRDRKGVKDLSGRGRVEWAKITSNFSYDVDEPEFQTTPEEIVDILAMRNHDMHMGIFELMEEALWSSPTSPNDDPMPWMGIPFWLQSSTTTPAGAFLGGNPANFPAGAADIEVVAVPNWRNWTFAYTDASRDDLVVKLRKSLYKTDFNSPHMFPQLDAADSDFIHFTTFAITEDLAQLTETRNENLGVDLDKFRGAIILNGAPIVAVPYLDQNDESNKPWYGVNFGVFRPYVKKGRDMVRHKPKIAANQHSVREIHLDHWSNFICLNRRRCFRGIVE